MHGRRSLGSSTTTVVQEVEDSTPPPSRKARHCRTCGLPMLGHKKALCTPPEEFQNDAMNLTSSLENLDLDEVKEQIKSPSPLPTKKRSPPRSNPRLLKEEPDTSPETPIKQEQVEPPVESDLEGQARDTPVSKPAESPFRNSTVMPGTLLRHDDDSDEDNALRPQHQMSRSEPTQTTKKRKTVRVSLPGFDSSIRLERAKHLEVSRFETDLTTMFIKTTLQHSGLFTVSTSDCEALERAADALGLQSHYVKRSNPDRVKSGQEVDANLVIIAKNQKAIDDTLYAMEKETRNAAPPGTTVTTFYLAQLTAGIMAGAAVMWAGLAFA